jgi:hypothetical protein
MESQQKPLWITDELWCAVTSIDWWADSRKRMEYIAQSKPVTLEEAFAQTMRLRNMVNELTDAKPQNVVMDENGKMHFIDLDIAKTLKKIIY